jgi:hypothetical protein
MCFYFNFEPYRPLRGERHRNISFRPEFYTNTGDMISQPFNATSPVFSPKVIFFRIWIKTFLPNLEISSDWSTPSANPFTIVLACGSHYSSYCHSRRIISCFVVGIQNPLKNSPRLFNTMRLLLERVSVGSPFHILLPNLGRKCWWWRKTYPTQSDLLGKSCNLLDAICFVSWA